MPPQFQQITDAPADAWRVQVKAVSSDGWVLHGGPHASHGAAVEAALAYVQPPTNGYQAQVLDPGVTFQKAS